MARPPRRFQSAPIAILVAACIVICLPRTHAQTAAPPAPSTVPSFDVISVKPNNSLAHQMMLNYSPDGMRASNLSVTFLLREAFSVNDNQIVGAPGWAQSSPWDIDARVAGADVTTVRNLTREQRRAMMLQVLTDRFKLAYHEETRTLPEYTLVVAKGGPKLQESKPVNDEEGKPKRGGRMMMQNGSLTAEGMQMEGFARMLSDRVGRPIINKTGLDGSYDFKLQWTEDRHAGQPPPWQPASARRCEAVTISVQTTTVMASFRMVRPLRNAAFGRGYSGFLRTPAPDA